MESELLKKIQQQDTSKTKPELSKTDLAPGLSPSVDPIPSYISCRPKTRIESAALVIVSCEYMACICRNWADRWRVIVEAWQRDTLESTTSAEPRAMYSKPLNPFPQNIQSSSPKDGVLRLKWRILPLAIGWQRKFRYFWRTNESSIRCVGPDEGEQSYDCSGRDMRRHVHTFKPPASEQPLT